MGNIFLLRSVSDKKADRTLYQSSPGKSKMKRISV
ncbi:hypothetical protein LEP1GSC065_4177, partial [Leptospira kirschneri serovar Sokoine str. RM1]